ncbi:MAG TPA: hopanoid biosynthesis-associated protein HpnK [Candidatus Binataceae bacterium]|nr:hopanoid biosynthesis-associated protein HpnK [Candidatus Binataceae bacterium]
MACLIKPGIGSAAASFNPDGRAARAGKAVIITADDFGLSREVNAGVVRAHREGILTATSLIVAGAARDEAAAIARATPTLDVGLHLVVCRGFAVTAPADLAGLVDTTGAFAQNPTLAGMRYFFNRRMRAMLTREIRAQIELHLQLVGYLNHLDGHLNFHAHPVIVNILMELAAEYRIPCIRIPREPVFTTLALARDHMARKLVEAIIFRALSRRLRRRLESCAIRTTDWLFGLHQSGHLSERYLIGIIRRLRPGITEIYFHPAEDIGATPPPTEAQAEVRMLISAKVRAALDSAGVALTSFAASR